jgi:hypothetical protein
MAEFKPTDFTFEETFVDADGEKSLARIVEPVQIAFEGDTITCECADGRSITVKRSEIQQMGRNPFTRMPAFITKDGVAISVPETEDADPSTAEKWFSGK